MSNVNELNNHTKLNERYAHIHACTPTGVINERFSIAVKDTVGHPLGVQSPKKKIELIFHVVWGIPMSFLIIPLKYI